MPNIYLPQPPPTKGETQLLRWFTEIWQKLGRKGAVLGALKFGDPDNNTEFEDDGTLKLNGMATVWNDINLPAANLKPGATPPTWGPFFVSGGVEGYLFSPTVEDMLHTSSEIIHGYKEGTDIQVHVHWMPVTSNVGVVRWGLEYVWVNNDGAIASTPTTIYKETTSVGTAWAHQRSDFPMIIGTGKTIGSAIIMRVFRDATNINDTFTGDAAMIQIGIHYEIDTIGSRNISDK